jgi:hypothetical protein
LERTVWFLSVRPTRDSLWWPEAAVICSDNRC